MLACMHAKTISFFLLIQLFKCSFNPFLGGRSKLPARFLHISFEFPCYDVENIHRNMLNINALTKNTCKNVSKLYRFLTYSFLCLLQLHRDKICNKKVPKKTKKNVHTNYEISKTKNAFCAQHICAFLAAKTNKFSLHFHFCLRFDNDRFYTLVLFMF